MKSPPAEMAPHRAAHAVAAASARGLARRLVIPLSDSSTTSSDDTVVRRSHQDSCQHPQRHPNGRPKQATGAPPHEGCRSRTVRRPARRGALPRRRTARSPRCSRPPGRRRRTRSARRRSPARTGRCRSRAVRRPARCGARPCRRTSRSPCCSTTPSWRRRSRSACRQSSARTGRCRSRTVRRPARCGARPSPRCSSPPSRRRRARSARRRSSARAGRCRGRAVRRRARRGARPCRCTARSPRRGTPPSRRRRTSSARRRSAAHAMSSRSPNDLLEAVVEAAVWQREPMSSETRGSRTADTSMWQQCGEAVDSLRAADGRLRGRKPFALAGRRQAALGRAMLRRASSLSRAARTTEAPQLHSCACLPKDFLCTGQKWWLWRGGVVSVRFRR